jgi:hypothetical protein
VKKWSEREITDDEREAIPDRDEMVFDKKVIEHLPQKSGKHTFIDSFNNLFQLLPMKLLHAVKQCRDQVETRNSLFIS